MVTTATSMQVDLSPTSEIYEVGKETTQISSRQSVQKATHKSESSPVAEAVTLEMVCPDTHD